MKIWLHKGFIDKGRILLKKELDQKWPVLFCQKKQFSFNMRSYIEEENPQ